MVPHPLILLLSLTPLAASRVGAAELQQPSQSTVTLARIRRPAPAAVLRPVEPAPLSSVTGRVANVADLTQSRHIERRPSGPAPLKPASALEGARAASSTREIEQTPRLADRWLPPARLYTVASVGP
jgi:hypothetical protein